MIEVGLTNDLLLPHRGKYLFRDIKYAEQCLKDHAAATYDKGLKFRFIADPETGIMELGADDGEAYRHILNFCKPWLVRKVKWENPEILKIKYGRREGNSFNPYGVELA